jgi:hypothetical protein
MEHHGGMMWNWRVIIIVHSMVEAMAFALPSIPGVQFWRHDVAGNLVASNVTDAAGRAWSYEDSLETSGLRPCPATRVP